MFNVLPADIKKTRAQVSEERRKIKQELSDQLTEYGEKAHIYKLFNQQSPITYISFIAALNPKHALWSQRVIDFAIQYIATRDALRHSSTKESK